MKRTARALIDHVARQLTRHGFGDPASDPLDAYGMEAPNPQALVDIFKGGWSSKFPDAYGVQAGTLDLFEDPRVGWLIRRIGDLRGRRVLELGPLEGAHSYMLERAGAESVLAIEACVMSYLKCLIVKELTHLERVTFQFGNFMPFLATGTDRFDLIVASGVLYHQRDPLLCLQRISQRTNLVFVWTHYYDERALTGRLSAGSFRRVAPVALDGFECDLFRIYYDAYLKHGKYRGGVDDHAHWMRRDDILACLRHFGLNEIEIAFEQREHEYGPNFALLARRALPSDDGRRS